MIVDRSSRVENLSAERIQRMLAINVTGSFLCAREAVKRMSTKHGGKGGAIVNVSSMAAKFGGAGDYVDYAASKGAIDSLTVGLATMTGNAAQAIVDDLDWAATLAGIHDALRPDGHLVFETRDPAREAWREWTRATTHEIAEVDGVGRVEHWGDLVDVSLPLVTFRWTFVFEDGEILTSDSTLRFRERDEVASTLAANGYVVEDVRDAPDRPGREFVFVARRL